MTAPNTAPLTASTRATAAASRSRGRDRRRTVLQNGAASVATVEHVLSAVWGMGIDNVRVEMDADEPPGGDGSPQAFAEALARAGAVEQDAERDVLVIERPVNVSRSDASLVALPGSGDGLEILYVLEYEDVPSIGRQIYRFVLGRDDYAAELAPARTFLLEEEAKAFQSQGMGVHLTAGDILVMSDEGPIDNAFRFPDELVRHKVADLVGDLALLGRRIRGRLVAHRSGHELNHAMVRRLAEGAAGSPPGANGADSEPVLDIRGIMRLLPHRYPFLMVDRIVRVEGDEKAIGIKNVTINEPYFQGHYPAQPIMPGVMILEALAQMSGILLSRRLEHAGKVAVLLSMDRVKMRRPVRPGDQMILEARALRVRPRTGHCACRAMVLGEVVAEAEVKFMLVDAEPA